MKVIKNRLNGKFNGIERSAALKKWIATECKSELCRPVPRGGCIRAMAPPPKFSGIPPHKYYEHDLFFIINTSLSFLPFFSPACAPLAPVCAPEVFAEWLPPAERLSFFPPAPLRCKTSKFEARGHGRHGSFGKRDFK
ncbi:unnamed protein product, partial [Nesidiocoris tenuis]